MKYLAIIFLSVAFVHPALAAKSVNGTLPKVEPLQPPPVGVYPNLENNIQFHDPSFDYKSNSQSGGQNALTGQNQNPAQQNAAQSAVQKSPAQSSAGGYVFLWVIAILILAGLGWLALIMKKSKKDV
jgi:hypothetical protein